MTNTESSARMLTRTLATLAAAFALVLTAVLGVMSAMVSDTNQLEATRQRERVETALTTQAHLRRLRFDNLQAAGVLQPVLNSLLPSATLQWAFAQVSNRFLDFDGTYLVTASGRVLAGIEHGETATQAGYDALARLRLDLPGGAAPAEARGIGDGPVTAMLLQNGLDTVGVMAADLRRGEQATRPASPEAAAFIVGYRKVTQAQLDELALRYRLPRLEVVTERPANPLGRRDIPSPDGTVSAWLSWTPERPGDAMISQFAWALGAVSALFAALFVYVFLRLRNAAQQIALRESQIHRLAGQDELSGLSNRRTFDLRLDQEIAQLGRTKSGLAVLLLDLDRFKGDAPCDTFSSPRRSRSAPP